VNGCTYSTDTQSGYQTFGAMAARALNADASILANSGWGLIRGAGALPSVYANTLGTSASPAWDFAQKPQAVVINLGSNDYRSGDPGQAFVDAYVQFTSAIRAKYPKAWILLGTGDVQNGADLDSLKVHVKAVIDARAAQGDDRMSELDFGTQNALLGTGCDWHPNVAEHKRMADLLVAELKVKLGW
jgi:hypothetical protein